jgi:membrane protease YdiL (CAAX protease family)
VPGETLRALIEVFLCSGVPSQILLHQVLVASGVPDVTPEGHLSMPFVLSLLLADTVVVVALMTALTRARGETVRDLWLGRRPVRRELVVGLLLIAPVFLSVVVLLNVLRLVAPWLHNVPSNPLEQLAGATSLDTVAFAVAAIVGGGVREELQRAFLLRRFEQRLGGKVVGVLVVSMAFGLGHFVQGWDAIVTTGLLGAFWAIVYLRRGSSVAPMVSHAGFNAIEVLLVAIARGATGSA